MTRKNRRFPFLDEFDNFGFSVDLQKMLDEMNAIVEHMENDTDMVVGKPVYYGYSVRVGPDGVPHVKKWGNARPPKQALYSGADLEVKKAVESCGCEPESIREPASTDASCSDIDSCYASTMYDDKANVLKIHADIPGITKEDIDLELKDNKLILDAKNESRHYHKEIPIDHNVDPKSIKAEYNNGVLEITLKCKDPKKPGKSKKIKVD